MITMALELNNFAGEENILRQLEVLPSNDYNFSFTLDSPINVFSSPPSSEQDEDAETEMGVENEADVEEDNEDAENEGTEEGEQDVEEDEGEGEDEDEGGEEEVSAELNPESETKAPLYRRELSNDMICYIYDSIHDLIASADGTIFDGFRAVGKWSDEYLGRHLPSWEAIKDAVTQPWEEGLNAMMSLIQQIEDCELPEPKDKRRHTRFGHDDGDELDFDRLRGGQDYWRYSSRDDRPGPAEITIISATSISRHVDPMALLWNGAAAVALTKILEDHGYRVELWIADSCRVEESPKKIMTATRLKSPLDSIDYSGFANAISAWFYRGVSIINHYGILEREIGKRPEHIYVSHYSEEDVKKITPDENVIEIRNVLSLEAALNFVRTQLQKLMQPASV